MYNRRYRKCCCQKNYDNDVIETACNECGVTANYYTSNKDSSCDCGFEESENVFPSNPMFGQSYVPMQKMTNVFTPICGLKNGSLFPELVSPYYPCQSVEDIEYLKSRNEIGKGCNTCS